MSLVNMTPSSICVNRLLIYNDIATVNELPCQTFIFLVMGSSFACHVLIFLVMGSSFACHVLIFLVMGSFIVRLSYFQLWVAPLSDFHISSYG